MEGASLKKIVGEGLLNEIQKSYVQYLESSAAIYENSGDYAAALFSSGYCDFLNRASREMAGKTDEEALRSGRWICHEDCWAVSLKSIKDKKPCEIECSGGIKIYAAPIIAEGVVIGSNNAAVSNPPTDDKKITEIAGKYRVDPKELLKIAKEYSPRPEHIFNAARNHITVAAKAIAAFFLRWKAGEESERLLHGLGERMKELGCLYGFSRIVEEPSMSLGNIFEEAARLIPSGWCYPDMCCARIVFEGREFTSGKFRTSTWGQAADIKVSGNKIGAVEIYYLEEQPERDEGPFLEEERDLLNALAERLGKVVERKKAEESLREYAAQLKDQRSLLEQKTLALSELIEHMERTKNKTKEDIARNVEEFITPILKKLKLKGASRKYLDLLQHHLAELTASFGQKITRKRARLSPRQIEIAGMIKGGLSSKEIAELLDISYTTVDKHRRDIRKKLGISRKKVNLTSFLRKV